MAALKACIAKGVTVSVLLEESQLEGGTLTFDSLALLKKKSCLGPDFSLPEPIGR